LTRSLKKLAIMNQKRSCPDFRWQGLHVSYFFRFMIKSYYAFLHFILLLYIVNWRIWSLQLE
jgi:hypothetical protein